MRGLVLVMIALFAVGWVDPPAVDDTKLNVFVVPHSHDDAGWLRTVDEYFDYEVTYILDTVFETLYMNPHRKFVYAEIAFFTRWWNQQSEERRRMMKEVVQRGQLEFVNGGWVMNDEADTIYQDIINQISEGHEFLLKTFNVAPRVAWHIDPFGSSNMSPYLYDKMGFEGFVINRIDCFEKQQRMESKGMDFMWQGSYSAGPSSRMLTHVLDHHYGTPDGFNFEHGVSQNLPAGDGPTVPIDSPPSYVTKANVQAIAERYLDVAKQRSVYTHTPHVMIPLGNDFVFQNADMRFTGFDRILSYINQHSEELNATARYSTVSDYFDAVRSSHASGSFPELETVTKDFFPYRDNPTSYWTGFYTSRPNQKQAYRKASAMLRAAESLFVLMEPSTSDYGTDGLRLQRLRHASALVQHHDAITGTERQHVALDYRRRIDDGIANATQVLTSHLAASIGTIRLDANVTKTLCRLLSTGSSVNLVMYNSLGWARSEYVSVRIPVQGVAVSTQGSSVEHQVNVMPGSSDYELVFKVQVPPFGHAVYSVTPSTAAKAMSRVYEYRGSFDPQLENEHIVVQWSSKTNTTSTILLKELDRTLPFRAQVQNYEPRGSGAYIFSPSGAAPSEVYSNSSLMTVHGPLVQSAVQVYSDWIHVESRVYTGLDVESGAQIETLHSVGPIPAASYQGHEIAVRFSTDIDHNGVFYTDNNGLEMQKRQRSQSIVSGTDLSGNFYPVVTRARLQDEDVSMTLLVGHPHAGSSVTNGSLELLLHRRLMQDDGRGVGEPLNIDTVIHDPIVIQFAPTAQAARRSVKASHRLQFPLVTVVDPSGLRINGQRDTVGLAMALPPQVHLLTLKRRYDGSSETVLRLAHVFAKGEDDDMSVPVEVNLDRLFRHVTIASCKEVTLSLNRELPPLQNWTVVLHPMEIRSFILALEIKP